MTLIWGAVGVYLLVGSIYDKKSRTLPGWFLGIGILVGILCRIFRMVSGELLWQQWITACLPGVLWIVLSFFARGQMGYGDGLILLTLGSLTDVGTTFRLMMLGLGAGCILGIFLLVTKKGNRHTAIPFVPMLLLAYGMMTGGWLLF